jgi:hypothetical protein
MSAHQHRGAAVEVTSGADLKIAMTIVFTDMTRRWRPSGGVTLCLSLCTVFADGFS